MKSWPKKSSVSLLSIGMAAALLALAVVAWSADGRRAVDPVHSIRALNEGLELHWRNENRLHLVAAQGAAQYMKLRVRETEYECELIDPADEHAEARIRALTCYELQSQDAEESYYRAVWMTRPVLNMRLFGHGPAQNYLAWVEGRAVYIEEVSESLDKKASLIRLLDRTDNRLVVPVEILAGREPFMSLNAIHSDIEILLVERSDSEGLRVKVRGPHTGEVFSLAQDGDAWQLEATD